MFANQNDSIETIRAGLEMEYRTLRDEILRRIEMRQQLVSITLTIAAAFLGFGLTTPSVALVYPSLAAFLAIGWHQNDLRVRDAAKYIRENIETKIPGLGWEKDASKKRGESSGTVLRIFSHGGIFLLSQLIAVAIGLIKFTFTTTDWALLGLSVIAVLFVVWILAREFHMIAR
jgi:hypothetical protein